MNTEHRPAAWSRRILTVAWLAARWANPALAATTPDISLTPATLSFVYTIGSPEPASQTLQVKSTGTALPFSIVVASTQYDGQWLTLSALSGTTTASIKVYVNPWGMPAGSYQATIEVDSPTAATPAHILQLTLDVSDPPPTFSASPASLAFVYQTGASSPPIAQSVVLTAVGAAQAVSVAAGTATWLQVSGAFLLLDAMPTIAPVSVNPAGLAPGSYAATLTFTSPSASPKTATVSVTLTVSAGDPVIDAGGIWPAGVPVNSSATTITITGQNYFVGKSVAYAGTTALVTTVISPTAMLATIPSTLLTTPDVDLLITVVTQTAADPSAAQPFSVYGPGPKIFAVADAASYSTTGISPGEIVTIFGVGLGPATLALFPGTSLPTSLPVGAATATSVTIDGATAPLIYASAGQVSCIVPYAVTSGTSVDVVVTYGADVSDPASVNVVDADPGIFTLNSSGTGQGAILNIAVAADSTVSYSVNGASNAAAKGSMVAIYLTGFGQTNPPGDETQFIPVSGTPVVPVGAVSVTIGGQPATGVAAAAPAGSVPGFLQVNATLPAANITAGSAVPVVVSIGSAQSQARVTMAVK
jgi:uncharacterized protein (TIGR03437 family)